MPLIYKQATKCHIKNANLITYKSMQNILGSLN